MQLIILAAGTGSRLGSVTKNIPKSLIKIKGKSIIDYQIKQFERLKIKKIIIVTGFASAMMQKKLGVKFKYVVNKKYKTTNNIYSLWLARHHLVEETIITFADLIMSKNIIRKIVKSKKNYSLAIDTSRILDGTMKVKVKSNRLLKIGKSVKKNANGNFIGVAKIKKNKIKSFRNSLNNIIIKKKKDYYTEVFNYLIKKDQAINYIDVKPDFWAEIDNRQDLEKLKKEIISKNVYNDIR